MTILYLSHALTTVKKSRKTTLGYQLNQEQVAKLKRKGERRELKLIMAISVTSMLKSSSCLRLRLATLSLSNMTSLMNSKTLNEYSLQLSNSKMRLWMFSTQSQSLMALVTTTLLTMGLASTTSIALFSVLGANTGLMYGSLSPSFLTDPLQILNSSGLLMAVTCTRSLTQSMWLLKFPKSDFPSLPLIFLLYEKHSIIRLLIQFLPCSLKIEGVLAVF